MSASTLSLRTNLADYPATMALKEGRVSSPLVNFDFCGPKVANNGFKPMLREGAFDAGELAIITYLQARAWNKPFIMLPAPISGRTQHHCIAYNGELGHLEPKDIEGRQVGVRTYSQTTGLWVRGVLQHEYGVDLDKVTWLTIDESHISEYRDPPNCRQLSKGANLIEMMMKGEIAAAIMGGDMPKDPRVQTLVPNAREAAKEWAKREGVMPLNHVFVVHERISKERPDVVRELFRLVRESRAQSPEASKTPLPFGYAANRKGLEMAIQWSFEQKIIPRMMSVDELFDETTASLEI